MLRACRVKARKTLATMAHNSGKLEVAAEHFDAMLTDNPGDFQSRQKYNWILAGMGDIGAALWHYGRACHSKVCGQQWDRGFSHNMVRTVASPGLACRGVCCVACAVCCEP
jgi:hypothetical protein